MHQLTPDSQPEYTTAEVAAIFARAKQLAYQISPSCKLVNARLGAFRSEKRLETRDGRFILRAVGSTVPGRGAGKRYWFFEFLAIELEQLAQDAKLFGVAPSLAVTEVSK
jgi:hypothetical protein